MNITHFVDGDCIRLMDFGHTDLQYRRRLLSLGMTRGVVVQIIRRAPLGCPVQVDVRGTSLTLREEEAMHLIWEPVSCISS
jgi:ferrous iron transport protein A